MGSPRRLSEGEVDAIMGEIYPDKPAAGDK